MHIEFAAISKPKILIAEDNNIIRRLYQHLLGDKYCIVICKDGEQAIDTFSCTKGINLVITDYEMPKMNGKDVIGHIRQSDRSATPIILASSINPETYQGYYQYDRFLRKPVDPVTLTTTIECLLN